MSRELHWISTDTIDAAEGDEKQVRPYVEIERCNVAGGFLVRAVTRTWDGAVMGCSLAFIPDVGVDVAVSP